MRDPAEAALNELQSRCREAAHLYEQSEERATDPGVQALFASLAKARRSQSSQLQRRVAAQGVLPEDLDPDPQRLPEGRGQPRLDGAACSAIGCPVVTED